MHSTHVKADPSLHILVTFRSPCFCCLSFLKFHGTTEGIRSKRWRWHGCFFICVDAKISSLHHYFHTGFNLYRVFIFLKILQTHKEKNRFQLNWYTVNIPKVLCLSSIFPICEYLCEALGHYRDNHTRSGDIRIKLKLPILVLDAKMGFPQESPHITAVHFLNGFLAI